MGSSTAAPTTTATPTYNGDAPGERRQPIRDLRNFTIRLATAPGSRHAANHARSRRRRATTYPVFSVDIVTCYVNALSKALDRHGR